MLRHQSGFLGVALLVVTAGCGRDSGASRSEVSGRVTFQGAPVHSGTVTFEPDITRGNSGPQSIASIQDGVYKTPYGLGPEAGHFIVRVEGFGQAEKVEAGTLSFPQRLFQAYETQAEISSKSNTLDIDVPSP
ncbi:hypothetical protein SH661x_001169 [Planctomicrobium sp. SH661]|uniref:hypothetical protein n=1 Tax=Planctomicrobium sp. SH661 TaxID=3448124 RepID=UPI003F5BB768